MTLDCPFHFTEEYLCSLLQNKQWLYRTQKFFRISFPAIAFSSLGVFIFEFPFSFPFPPSSQQTFWTKVKIGIGETLHKAILIYFSPFLFIAQFLHSNFGGNLRLWFGTLWKLSTVLCKYFTQSEQKICLQTVYTFFFISNRVAKGSGLKIAQKLSNLLSNPVASNPN